MSVSLNSNYAVCAKVNVGDNEVKLRDGELKYIVDGNEISAKRIGTWQYSEFESGGVPTAKEVAIEVNAVGRTNAHYEQDFTIGQNTNPNFSIVLSAHNVTPYDIYLNWPLSEQMLSSECHYSSIADMLHGKLPDGAKTGLLNMKYPKETNPSRYWLI